MQKGHIIIDTTSEQHYNRKAKVKALQNTLKLQKHIRTTTRNFPSSEFFF